MSHRTPAGRTREVGSLVAALEPALQDQDGVWLGANGEALVDESEPLVRASFPLQPGLYETFCNSVLWPLLHGFPNRVRFADGDFNAYVHANEQYARQAMTLVPRDATIWVHDYDLLLAARALRALGHQGRIGLFVHVPFPSRDVMTTIPWGTEIIEAMLEFDLVGFQTQQFATNFLACAHGTRNHRRRVVEVGVFPATIDPNQFREPNHASREIAGLRAELGDRRLVLAVDRLDHSTGILERLDAYDRMLDRSPSWRRRVSFLQVSIPTGVEIPDCAELRERVEGMVGRINGKYGDTDWVPVCYLYRSYDHEIRSQLYRLADVALVTPLRDGMNLVAKEFVAAQDPSAPGVLVLSQYAGAADTLSAALLTNPFHPEGLAADLDHALSMPKLERMQRHRMLLAALEREGDAKAWTHKFLARLATSTGAR